MTTCGKKSLLLAVCLIQRLTDCCNNLRPVMVGHVIVKLGRLNVFVALVAVLKVLAYFLTAKMTF